MQNFPELSGFYESHHCTLLTEDIPSFLPYFKIVIFTIMVVTVVNISVFVAIFYGMHRMRSQMSVRTYRMHKQLIISISLQVECSKICSLKYNESLQCVIPLSFVGIPYVVLATSALYQWDSSQGNCLYLFIYLFILYSISSPLFHLLQLRNAALCGQLPISDLLNPTLQRSYYQLCLFASEDKENDQK